MKRKKGGGGKLNRSEILQARLDPKLRLAAEIMARSQRRTLSSFIEFLIDEAMTRYKIPALLSANAQIDAHLLGKIKSQKILVKEMIDKIWSSEEADRFALFLPDLLTAEEAALWQRITETPYFWEHFEINIENRSGKTLEKENWPIVSHHNLIREHLREHWLLLKAILEGKQKLEKLSALKLKAGRVILKPSDYPHEIKKIKN